MNTFENYDIIVSDPKGHYGDIPPQMQLLFV